MLARTIAVVGTLLADLIPHLVVHAKIASGFGAFGAIVLLRAKPA
ncbi:hypothetical protein J2Y66_004200 [Paenarthrobacter nitroguajacolicus]|nr:hypothetical protein [Paenarthrobacter nitroguajacolicus]MDR6989683.1 hypothetical protein [Paenarthrobacter nitroguajacolicus]